MTALVRDNCGTCAGAVHAIEDRPGSWLHDSADDRARCTSEYGPDMRHRAPQEERELAAVTRELRGAVEAWLARRDGSSTSGMSSCGAGGGPGEIALP
jgi:hypothetical protein